MAPDTDGGELRLTQDDSVVSNNALGPSRRDASDGGIGAAIPDGLEIFQQRWQMPGFLEEASAFISQAWAPSTKKRYSSAWKAWVRW